MKTFYRRPLPLPSIEFSSQEGRTIFREALADGTAEGFFELSAHFTTQVEPSFCGLASLSMVLNALHIDPGRQWKGVRCACGRRRGLLQRRCGAGLTSTYWTVVSASTQSAPKELFSPKSPVWHAATAPKPCSMMQ